VIEIEFGEWELYYAPFPFEELRLKIVWPLNTTTTNMPNYFLIHFILFKNVFGVHKFMFINSMILIY